MSLGAIDRRVKQHPRGDSENGYLRPRGRSILIMGSCEYGGGFKIKTFHLEG